MEVPPVFIQKRGDDTTGKRVQASLCQRQMAPKGVVQGPPTCIMRNVIVHRRDKLCTFVTIGWGEKKSSIISNSTMNTIAKSTWRHKQP